MFYKYWLLGFLSTEVFYEGKFNGIYVGTGWELVGNWLGIDWL